MVVVSVKLIKMQLNIRVTCVEVSSKHVYKALTFRRKFKIWWVFAHTSK
jgi:hypothetical protein